MEAHNPYINHLFQRYLEGNYSEEDLDTLLAYFKLDEDSEQLRELIEQQFEKPMPESIDQEEVSSSVARIGKELDQKINTPQEKRTFKWWYAAASIFLISLIGTFAYLSYKNQELSNQIVSKYGDDVLPGTNRAFITLSDGSKYDLREDQGELKIKNGDIAYADGSSLVSNSGSSSATINTPNGGQYRLVLEDGTKVILNSGSSLTYPTRFNTDRREVTLQGEAYFEVAKNSKVPFIVNGLQQRIEVLGTKFNASFYSGEQTATTLVEGKVKVNTGNGNQAVLSPGDQAVSDNDKLLVQEVYTQDYISWINNQFVFNNTSLVEVFAQLERWYDVQFEFPKELAQKKIYAEISRERKLSEVLQTLEDVVNLNFTISGRRVFVRK